MIEEAAANDDVTLVDAEADLHRSVGPLVTLLRWYECALHAWPRAALIGKADDDVWIDMLGVAAHLRASVSLLAPADFVWGKLESYHWNISRHGPQGFGFTAPRQPCRNAGDLVGPWPFPKGPLFFLTRSLVAMLHLDGGVRDEARRSVAAWANVTQAEADALRVQRIHIPYEDTFVGFGLSVATPSPGSAPAAWVDVGPRAFGQEWYHGRVALTATTLVWHARVKDRGCNACRIRAAHHWAQRHRCYPEGASQLQLVSNYGAVPCAGNGSRSVVAIARDAAYAGCNATPASREELGLSGEELEW